MRRLLQEVTVGLAHNNREVRGLQWDIYMVRETQVMLWTGVGVLQPAVPDFIVFGRAPSVDMYKFFVR